jgi:LysM repeat protein
MTSSPRKLAVFTLAAPVMLVALYAMASVTTPRPTSAESGIVGVYAAALESYENPAAHLAQMPPAAATNVIEPTPSPVSPQQVAFLVQAQTSASPTAVQINPTYVVARGDTLFQIAQRFGVRVDAIASASGLTNINDLRIGQVLVLPLYTPTAAPEGQVTLPVTPLMLLTNSPTPIASSTAMPSAAQTATPEIFATNTPDPAATSETLLVAEVQLAPTMLLDDETTSGMAPIATATFIPPRGDATINDIPIEDYVIMDEVTRQHVREIFALGQTLGRDPRAFSKVGDSTIENPYFMDRFDTPDGYNLASYAWLQPAIDWFRGSFSRDSVAVRVGMHSWTIMDPMWADPYQCPGGESPLECEFRLHNPAFVIFRIGSNDVGVAEYVENSMRDAIEYSLEQGVVPIIGTKGDRHEGSNANNEVFRRLAEEYRIPLWDFDALAGSIPNRGMGSDGTHMTTFYLHDYSSPVAFQTGHGVHSLAALVMLDSLWRVIYGGE